MQLETGYRKIFNYIETAWFHQIKLNVAIMVAAHNMIQKAAPALVHETVKHFLQRFILQNKSMKPQLAKLLTECMHLLYFP